MDNDKEKKLAQFLKDSAAIGYGKTRVEVMNIAESSAKKKVHLGETKSVQDGWKSSLKGKVRNLWGDNTANTCMDAVNADTISHYDNLL